MFIPHTDLEREEMLKVIGVKTLEDLFKDVPEACRFPKLDLAPALTEMEVYSEMQDISKANETARDLACFLGAGAYNHYIPAAVDSLLQRGEFYTAYTPYQPEISQGTLQAIFEYQSLIAMLTGMEVCNASHYDGATAVAEAGVLAYHHFREKRKRFVLSLAVHPHYRETLCTYLCGYPDLEIKIGGTDQKPLADPSSLSSLIDSNTALVVVQYPDFFGRIYDYTALAKTAHDAGALFTVVINPIALGLLKAPGDFGADIVVGEGQPLGIPLSFGGPYLGLFAARKDLVRKLSGRLVGETLDSQGCRGYVLTLTAREQHIRREKATSNICTNQGLMALASTIYLSLVGKHGLKQVAELCYHKAHYAASQIAAIPGFSVYNSTPFFHEFIVRFPDTLTVEEVNQHLLDHNVLGGYDLGTDYPSLKNHMLIAVTELNTRDQIDLLCEVFQEVSHA
jgi:glycine dehydrogenase subunit 1